MHLSRYGEEGLRIVFGDTIDNETSGEVRDFFYFVKSLHLPGVIDVIPSFRSCLIQFDSDRISFEALIQTITGQIPGTGLPDVPGPGYFELPVCYGGEYGPDMEFVCSYAGLDENQVIEIHTSTVYTVFAVGFMPGFPYLGALDRRLFVPRLETPRLKVPEGSVGLAQLQTGVYTYESPGGWRIIGKTERRLFDARQPPFSVLAIGDRVRFVAQ
jgi:inhibitor of KinA